MNIKALFKSLILRKFATGLLVLQLTLTLSLIVNSGILALDARDKLIQKTGMKQDSLLVVDFYPTAQAFADRSFYLNVIKQDIEAIKKLPGVVNAAPANQTPVQYGGWGSNIHAANKPEQEQLDMGLRYASQFYGTEELVDTLGVKLLEGRLLTAQDSLEGNINDDRNIVITASLAKAMFGEQSAVGQQTVRGHVVGVIEDFKVFINQPIDKQYVFFSNYTVTMSNSVNHYFIQVEDGMMKQVQQQIKDIMLANHPERDVRSVSTFASHMALMYGQDIGLAKLFGVLCLLMIFVTAISSFAYAQFHITKQKKFIGIRRALGATRNDVLLYVFSENWLLTALGMVLGLIGVYAINMLLAQSIAISKPQLGIYLLACLVTFVSGTIATWLPAWQTSRIPPVIATKTV